MNTNQNIYVRITEYLSNGGLFHDKVRDLLLACRTEIERLSGELSKANSDWRRLHDFVVGESPQEMFRWKAAFEKSKGIQAVQAYISSLWRAK